MIGKIKNTRKAIKSSKRSKVRHGLKNRNWRTPRDISAPSKSVAPNIASGIVRHWLATNSICSGRRR